MGRILKAIVHVLLFLVALVVFYVGLFAGLQINPNLGTGLWIAAAAIAALNTLWIVRGGRKRR